MGITSAFLVENKTNSTDAQATFDFCRNLIGARRRHRWTEGPSRIMPGAREYAMEPNQGLPVLLRVFYSPRGLPVVDEEQPAPPRTIEIHLDGGSSAAHDRALRGIGEWLNSKGWAWQWRDDSRDSTYDWRRVKHL